MQPQSLRISRTLVWLAIVVAVLSAAAAMLSGPGYQAGLWPYRTGFVILRWSAYCAAGAALAGVIGAALALAGRGFRLALGGVVALVIGAAVVVPAWQLERTGGEVPRIHDITTDTANPPQFVALLEIRKKSSNGPEYGGEKIARQQKAAYPDIQPIVLHEPPQAAFERALAAARAMGWEIVAAVPQEGRIEATATTRWFRFKDDVVVRVRAESNGSRIDVRSKSRVGRSDFGTNARRVRAYKRALTGGHSDLAN